MLSFNWLNLFFVPFILFIYCFCLHFWFLLFITLINTKRSFWFEQFWHDELLAKFMWNFNDLLIYKLCFTTAYQLALFPLFRTIRQVKVYGKTLPCFSILFSSDAKNRRSKQYSIRKWFIFFDISYAMEWNNKIEHVQDVDQCSTYMNLLCIIISPKCILVSSKMWIYQTNIFIFASICSASKSCLHYRYFFGRRRRCYERGFYFGHFRIEHVHLKLPVGCDKSRWFRRKLKWFARNALLKSNRFWL